MKKSQRATSSLTDRKPSTILARMRRVRLVSVLVFSVGFSLLFAVQANTQQQSPPSESAPPTLATAQARFDMASERIDREDLAGAEPLLREAADIQRRLAPGSVALARSLTLLGNVARARFDYNAAAPLLREAADILERLAPDTVDHAVSLN